MIELNKEDLNANNSNVEKLLNVGLVGITWEG